MIRSAAICALLFTACSPSVVVVQNVEELGQEMSAESTLADYGKDAVVFQHSSAENHYLFEQCFALAKMKLELNLSDQRERPVAVVVDVDETVLDNSRYELEQIAQAKTFTPASWSDWVERREAPALPGALRFLAFAKEKGCTIFYVTNRSAGEKVATMDNLQALGFPDADSAHVMTKENSSDKTPRRLHVGKTHDVLLYVGDQLRDYKELFKDRTANFGKTAVDNNLQDLEKYFVITPNVMYGTWRNAISGKGTSQEKVEFTNAFYARFLP